MIWRRGGRLLALIRRTSWVGLFGAAGEADRSVEASGSIPDDLIREVEQRAGIIVVPGAMR